MEQTGNPITGDPPEVLRNAQYYLEISAALQHSATMLRGLAQNSNEVSSRAIDAVRSDAGKIEGAVRQVSVRYDQSAQALDMYGRVIEQLKVDADVLVRQYNDAIDHVNQLEPRLRTLEELAAQPGPEQESARVDAVRMRTQSDQQLSVIRLAADELARLRAGQEKVAQQAIRMIEGAMEASNLDDTFLGDLGRLAGKVLDVLSKIVKVLALVVTILLIVVAALASFFFPALAAVVVGLVILAQVLAAVTAVIAVMQMVLSGFNFLDFIVAVAAALTAVVGGALIGALGEAIGKALSGIMTEVLGAALGKLAALGLKNLVTELMQDGLDTITDGILSLGSEDAREMFDAFKPGIEAALGSALGELKEGAAEFGTELGGALSDVGDDLGLDSIAEVVDGIFDAAAGYTGDIADLVDKIQTAIGANLPPEVVKVVTDFVTGLAAGDDPLTAGLDALGKTDIWSSLEDMGLDALSDFRQQLEESVGEYVAEFGDFGGMLDGIPGFDSIPGLGAYSGIPGSGGAAAGFVGDAKDAAAGFMVGARDTANGLLREAGQSASSILGRGDDD